MTPPCTSSTSPRRGSTPAAARTCCGSCRRSRTPRVGACSSRVICFRPGEASSPRSAARRGGGGGCLTPVPSSPRRETPLLPRWRRVWTIIGAGLRREFRRPAALFPVIAGVFLTTISAIFFLFLASLFNPSATANLESFYLPVSNPTMLFFVTLLASTVGAGLIADDVHTNALNLYLSRPITHVDYLIAKGAILGTLVILITILPLFIAALLAGLLSFVSWGVALAADRKSTRLNSSHSQIS